MISQDGWKSIGEAVADAVHYGKLSNCNPYIAGTKLDTIVRLVMLHSGLDRPMAMRASRDALNAVIDIMTIGVLDDASARMRANYGIEHSEPTRRTLDIPQVVPFTNMTKRITPLSAVNMMLAIQSVIESSAPVKRNDDYDLQTTFEFDPGDVLLVTPLARQRIHGKDTLTAIMTAHGSLKRNQLSESDHQLNLAAARSGTGYVWSSVNVQGQEFWVITDFSKRETCVLLPQEF